MNGTTERKELGASMLNLAVLCVASGIGMEESVQAWRKKMLEAALESTAGNICHAARKLRWHRNTAAREMEKRGLDHRDFRKKKPQSVHPADKCAKSQG